MSLGKKDIIVNISTKAHISSSLSKSLFDYFLRHIISNADNKIVKISRFGSFQKYTSPQRVGRNPKTKERFLITKRNKIKFNPSNNIRSILN